MTYAELKDTILLKITLVSETLFGMIPQGLQLDFPPKVELGHFAVACFSMSASLIQLVSGVSVE